MDNFSVDVLPSVAFDNRKSLPEIPAIYFAVSRWNEILYVGRAKHLRVRWMGHHLISELDYLGCSKIAWIEFEDTFEKSACLLKTERFFIKKFKPLLNKPQGKKSPHLETA